MSMSERTNVGAQPGCFPDREVKAVIVFWNKGSSINVSATTH